MMDISCDLTPPDLTPLTPVSVNCSSSTSSSSLSSPSVLSTSEPDQPATGEEHSLLLCEGKFYYRNVTIALLYNHKNDNGGKNVLFLCVPTFALPGE